MDEIRLATETEQRQGVEAVDRNEIRTLDELELALAGGGDGIVVWP